MYRARTNRLLEKDVTKNYEDYVAKVTTLGAADEVAKPFKAKFIESYNNMAASFANTDKIKAIEI
jgi:hypothetical protein